MRDEKCYEIIRKYKGLKGSPSKNIDIIDIDGQNIGRLITVNKDIANDNEIVQKMLDWREANKKWFFTGFNPQIEESKKWMMNENVLNDSKIFFLVEDCNQKLIGHLAVKDISNGCAELDNGIFGEKSDIFLFFYAQAYLIDFIIQKLSVEKIKIHVLDFNKKVLDMHKFLWGAKEKSQYYLYRTSLDQEIFQHIIVAEEEKNVDYKYIELCIERNNFYENANSFFSKMGSTFLFKP